MEMSQTNALFITACQSGQQFLENILDLGLHSCVPLNIKTEYRFAVSIALC